MLQTKILGTGIYAPHKILTNFDLEKMMETSDAWISERTGIKQRHIASPEKDESPSNMGVWAAQNALAQANLPVDAIDLILFATCKPDYPLPNTATIVQTKLGITNRCGAIDIMAACSGFVYGFNIADAMIRTGLCRHVLVIGSELLTPEVDWEDRGTCILFGDAAGAAVLGSTDKAGDSAVLASTLGADGSGKEFFFQEWGGAVKPMTAEILQSKERFMKMQGKEMFRVAVRTLASNATKVIEQAGLTLADVDWIVPHQANIRIIEATAKALNCPMDKVIVNIDRYGNTSAATIPLAFHEAVTDGRIKRGQVVLFDAFGAGLTSGATLIRY
jgi:3-oxoacyl-[acyl-carrier-protein] synthase-3